jgi:hypothetical protein
MPIILFVNLIQICTRLYLNTLGPFLCILVVTLLAISFKFMRGEKYMHFANICLLFHSHCYLSLEIGTCPCILLIVCFYTFISHVGFSSSSSSSFPQIEFLMQWHFLLSTVKLLLDFSHWLFSLLILMATFHVVGKPNLTILVFDYGVVQVTKNVLCAMFAFHWRYAHIFKDVSYKDNNIILSFVYQVSNVNLGRMFWTITNGKYRIVGKNVLNNFQDIVVTLGTTTSVANIAMGDILMKEKPSMLSHDLKILLEILFVSNSQCWWMC